LSFPVTSCLRELSQQLWCFRHRTRIGVHLLVDGLIDQVGSTGVFK
jgi:hypothetical protein